MPFLQEIKEKKPSMAVQFHQFQLGEMQNFCVVAQMTLAKIPFYLEGGPIKIHPPSYLNLHLCSCCKHCSCEMPPKQMHFLNCTPNFSDENPSSRFISLPFENGCCLWFIPSITNKKHLLA